MCISITRNTSCGKIGSDLVRGLEQHNTSPKAQEIVDCLTWNELTILVTDTVSDWVGTIRYSKLSVCLENNSVAEWIPIQVCK